MDYEELEYMVLINEDEQYCLWPMLSDVPEGWTQVGHTGSKQTCEAFVEENWIDMTPKSKRA